MTGRSGSNSTADRVLDVLGLFAEDHPRVTAEEVAEALAVGRSTAYRYLVSLVAVGLLDDDPAGGYRLGARVHELSRIARRSNDLATTALPVLEDLAETTGETALLTRLGGDRVVCIERAETTRAVRISYERGSVFPLNAGAASLALLAGLPEASARRLLAASPLPRHTARSVTDAAAQLERLREVRDSGIAISHGEVDDDVLGVAAPIVVDAQTVAAIGVAAVASRVPDARLEELIAATRAAAARISAALG